MNPNYTRSDSKVEVTGLEARHYDFFMNLITGGTYPFFIRRAIREMLPSRASRFTRNCVRIESAALSRTSLLIRASSLRILDHPQREMETTTASNAAKAW